jgi:pimeloyl-ACP methyl ester carboxylesterase
MVLFVREAGPVDAPTLVFLHGLWLSSTMWHPQIEQLKNEYHCLAPDLPEHGNSTDVGLLTQENTSLLVANLIRERAKDGRAHVIGFSLGGMVALGLLCDVPEVIDHLMVSGCGTLSGLGPLIRAASKLGSPLLHLLKPAPLLSLGLRLSQIPQPSLDLLLTDVRRLQPEAIIHFARGFMTMQLPQAVEARVLVTVGQKEGVLAKQGAQHLGRRLSAPAMTIPSFGHLWNLQTPDLFNETVRAFLTNQPLPQVLLALSMMEKPRSGFPLPGVK